jgi:hypothetical protein
MLPSSFTIALSSDAQAKLSMSFTFTKLVFMGLIVFSTLSSKPRTSYLTLGATICLILSYLALIQSNSSNLIVSNQFPSYAFQIHQHDIEKIIMKVILPKLFDSWC